MLLPYEIVYLLAFVCTDCFILQTDQNSLIDTYLFHHRAHCLFSVPLLLLKIALITKQTHVKQHYNKKNTEEKKKRRNPNEKDEYLVN